MDSVVGTQEVRKVCGGGVKGRLGGEGMAVVGTQEVRKMCGGGVREELGGGNGSGGDTGS